VTVDDFRTKFAQIRGEVSRIVVGQDEMVVHTLLAVLARGHILLEGPPGLGKTLLVRTLGEVLGCQSKRIQFTPDLMPSDVTGGNVFNQQKNAFEFFAGPVFTQLLLADEINRAPAKTQAALLEAMQERSATSDGVTRRLPQPFFVIATQNPIESQGTYPLPEAQLDRFLFKLNVLPPGRDVEKAILVNHLGGFDAAALADARIRQVVTPAELMELQAFTGTIRIDDSVLDYITDIVSRTRGHRALEFGASPRASIALLFASRVRAAAEGRDFVIPDDIKALVAPVLRHRIGVHPDAEIEGVSPDDCIDEILREVRVPKIAA
jgi:MoxR-like ATPase